MKQLRWPGNSTKTSTPYSGTDRYQYKRALSAHHGSVQVEVAKPWSWRILRRGQVFRNFWLEEYLENDFVESSFLAVLGGGGETMMSMETSSPDNLAEEGCANNGKMSSLIYLQQKRLLKM